MKKSSLCKILFGMFSLTLPFSLTSCKKNENQIKEYTINISTEGALIRDAQFAAGGNASLKQENFSAAWDAVIRGDDQPIPQVQTKNTKELTSFMNQDVYTISNGSYESIVLYIHGGAWVYQIDKLHFSFCDDLVEPLNAKIYLPIYDLAPNATFRETISFMKALYSELLLQGKPIYVMGDSAGGTISLDLIHALKESNIKMPERLVLLAPCSDLTFSNEEMKAIESRDPCLAIYGCKQFATLWADGEQNLTSPEVSALYADVSGYPKTMLVQGTDDILCPDNLKLCKKLCDAGVDTTLVKGEGLYHVFCVSNIPEKQQTINYINDFIK